MGKFLYVFLLAWFSPAALADAVTISPLLDSNSRMPGALVPFRVTGDLMATGGELYSAAVVSATKGADCRAMIDPYIRDIFLVKCSAPSEVSLKVRVLHDDVVYQISYGPVEFKYPVAGLVVIPPVSGDPDFLAGKQMFNAFCVNCHNPPTTKRGATWTAIKNAINSTEPKMAPLKGEFTDDELKKIEKYLKGI